MLEVHKLFIHPFNMDQCLTDFEFDVPFYKYLGQLKKEEGAI